MKKTILISLLLAGFTTQAQTLTCDLHFKKENLCASLIWVQAPVLKELMTAKDAASFDLQFWKEKNKAQEKFALPENEKFALALSMPSMHHGSQPVAISKDSTTPGLYHVTNVLFSMGGKWEFKAKFKKDGKEVDSAVMPYLLK